MFRSPRIATALVLFGACISAGVTAEAHAPKRHPVDVSDYGRLVSAHPHARQLLEEGETALEQRDPERAARLFAQAVEEAPTSALCARRHCQALFELGQRDAAVAACRRAVSREGSPLDRRALVRAILAYDERPNFESLNEITMAANRAQRSMPHQPWGYAAACDIARRLGDSNLLDACRKDLERVAPEHAETRRALAAAGSSGSAAGITAGWGAILLVVLATAWDAMRRAWQRRARSTQSTKPAENVT